MARCIRRTRTSCAHCRHSGCVLPGALNADELWRNLLEGVSGISEPGAEEPHYRDFFVVDEVVPDKTYSLLYGSAGTLEYDPRVRYTREEFFGLTRSQQLL